MAQEVASLFGTVAIQDKATAALKGIRGELGTTDKTLGGLQKTAGSLGAALTRFLGPAAIAGGLIAGTKAAIDFNASLTDARATLGQTAEDAARVHDEILKMGAGARAGPQAVAEAYYDVAGGVTDASTHLAILENSVKLAEAGQASLAVTTDGLINVMNSYQLKAGDAAHVTDVYTRAVGMGKGTMDQFVAAIGPAAGLFAQTGQSFDALGAAMAFLTTKGTSASQAMTELTAATVALMNPNQQMNKLLKQVRLSHEELAKVGGRGVKVTGEMLVKNLGLARTLELLKAAGHGSTEALTKALGSVEALKAAVALTGGDFKAFEASFKEGIEGATEAAKAIQDTSVQAKLDKLGAQLSAFAIKVGEAITPILGAGLDILTGLLGGINSVITGITNALNWKPPEPPKPPGAPETPIEAGMLGRASTVEGPPGKAQLIELTPSELLIKILGDRTIAPADALFALQKAGIDPSKTWKELVESGVISEDQIKNLRNALSEGGINFSDTIKNTLSDTTIKVDPAGAAEISKNIDLKALEIYMNKDDLKKIEQALKIDPKEITKIEKALKIDPQLLKDIEIGLGLQPGLLDTLAQSMGTDPLTMVALNEALNANEDTMKKLKQALGANSDFIKFVENGMPPNKDLKDKQVGLTDEAKGIIGKGISVNVKFTPENIGKAGVGYNTGFTSDPNAAQHDFMGAGKKGNLYEIGTKEFYVPGSDGYFFPMNKMGGGGSTSGSGGTQIIRVEIDGRVLYESMLNQADMRNQRIIVR